MSKLATRIAVALVFVALYLAFLAETGALVAEFQPGGLWFKLGFIYSHNFLFFPIGGLLALVAFYRPAVIAADALGRGLIAGGRVILAAGLAAILVVSLSLSDAFSKSNARSVFEIAPDAILAEADASRPPLAETLIRLRLASLDDEGLVRHQTRCDSDWLTYAPEAREARYCFVASGDATGAACCEAKAAFRQTLNQLHAGAPSRLTAVHRAVLPVKTGFLLMLLALGAVMVVYRPRLTQIYGAAVEDMSFPMAVGGGVMLLWPLMNQAYLESFALLTGDGSANSYKVVAPLYTLAFGVWAMLLVFFHLRSYPSQMEYAARLGGFIVAGVGVLQYQGLINYVIRTLGAGGDWMSLIIFASACLFFIGAILNGVRPQDIEPVARGLSRE